MRLDASTEKVNISKDVKFENDIQFNVGQAIKWTNVFIREVFSSRPEFDLIVNGSTSHMRMWVAGSIKQAITNTAIACKVGIDAEQGITVFNGQQLRTNIINSTNNNKVLQRNGSPQITLNSSEISYSNDLQMNAKKLEFNGDNIYLKYSVGSDSSDILDFVNTSSTTPRIRYFVGGVDVTDRIIQLYTDKIDCKRNVILDSAYELQTNKINSNSDNDLVLNRNNLPFLTLDKFSEDTVEKEAIICSKQLRANGNVLVNNLQINQFSVGVQYADFRLENADSVVRYFVGNGTNANFQITNAGISLNRETTIGSLKTNTINSNGSDLVFQREGTEFFRLNDQSSLLEVAVGHAVSAPDVYANDFLNRTRQRDTVFFGSVVSADARVEYMRWNYTDQSLDFNAPIDNTNIAVRGNIVDTTVSDERLKKNVQDVETNFCDCVKMLIKTFEYKDEKYTNNDRYSFIAQHLLENLPKEFDNIVKRN